eukprot:COSAG02_NODE_2294_length_9198_cov_3.122321_7_plen_191_part_00
MDLEFVFARGCRSISKQRSKHNLQLRGTRWQVQRWVHTVDVLHCHAAVPCRLRRTHLPRGGLRLRRCHRLLCYKFYSEDTALHLRFHSTSAAPTKPTSRRGLATASVSACVRAARSQCCHCRWCRLLRGWVQLHTWAVEDTPLLFQRHAQAEPVNFDCALPEPLFCCLRIPYTSADALARRVITSQQPSG